jgi:16S rRNA (cytosine967-C5)-methyltransferase
MPRPDQTPAMTAREVALRALRDVDTKEAFANLALDTHLNKSKLEGRDRGLATELVYGVTRRRATIDYVITQVATRPIIQIDPWIRNILRAAIYQLIFMERIPPSAAVDEAVELAKKYGHTGVAKFVNGVLRTYLRRKDSLTWPDPVTDPINALAITYSHPTWLVEAWVERYGKETAIHMMESDNLVPPLTLRVNRLKTSREELQATLAIEGIRTTPTLHSPQGLVVHDLNTATSLDKLKSMKSGLFTVQDESSMLVAPVLAPTPGQMVIDVAAAPGGKSTHIAELMANQGKVIAVDFHAHKIELIAQNAHRLNTKIVEGLCIDARDLGRHLPERADAILCDVPCSGLGTLARRPDSRWRKTAADIDALVPIQRAILESAAQALKPGGVLVYSTCTIHPSENQDLVQSFVGDHPEFSFDEIAPYLPESLQSGAQGGWIQLFPHIHGTDGFFIARLRKASR